MIVKCVPSEDGKKPCPMIQTCLARLTDGTITGCGIPLWYVGVISKDEVMVEHTIREERYEHN